MVTTDDGLMPKLKSDLFDTATYHPQSRNGHIAASAAVSRDDTLVLFCHGSMGGTLELVYLDKHAAMRLARDLLDWATQP